MDLKRQTTLSMVPDGIAGTRATLRAMAQFVKAGKRDPSFRDFVAKQVFGLANKNWLGEIQTCFEWVRSHIRYMQDPVGIEALAWPQATVELGYGDCDDMVILLSAMLEVIGHPTRFVACGFERYGEFTHVFLQTQLGSSAEWISLDPTEEHDIGWQPPDIVARLEWYP